MRRIPLHELNNEDLRILIGQNIGLEYLVPLAAAKLRMEPLSEGNLYPGDLLQNVLRADSKFWLAHIELRDEVTQIAKRAFSLLPSLCETDRKCAEEVLKAAYDIFERSDYFATHGRA